VGCGYRDEESVLRKLVGGDEDPGLRALAPHALSGGGRRFSGTFDGRPFRNTAHPFYSRFCAIFKKHSTSVVFLDKVISCVLACEARALLDPPSDSWRRREMRISVSRSLKIGATYRFVLIPATLTHWKPLHTTPVL
jgi:hypothetical protein